MMPNSDICKPYIVSLRPKNIVAYVTVVVSRQYAHIINNGELRPGVAIELLITPLYHLEILEERARFTKDYRNFLESVWLEKLDQMPPPMKKKGTTRW